MINSIEADIINAELFIMRAKYGISISKEDKKLPEEYRLKLKRMLEDQIKSLEFKI